MSQPLYRLVFQDVDGCLNPSNGEAFAADEEWQPTSHQIEMLASISQAVDSSKIQHWVINTGRYWEILKNIVKHLPTKKLRYIILEHGCVIYDRHEGKYLDLYVMAKQCGLNDLARRLENLGAMNTLLTWYDEIGQMGMSQRYGLAMPRLGCRTKKSNQLTKLSFICH